MADQAEAPARDDATTRQGQTAERPRAVSEAPPPATEAKASAVRRPLLRWALFLLLPVVLIAGGIYYVLGGAVTSTENAYVAADTVGITTDVSGLVDAIEVHDNEAVTKGQVLFRLRAAPFQYAVEMAEAKLGEARNQLLNYKASYVEAQAQIDEAQTDIPYFQRNYDRAAALLESQTAPASNLDDARRALQDAKSKVIVARAEAQSLLAQLGGDADQPVESYPLYRQAEAALADARRQLDDSVVRAPFDGVVSNVDNLQVGSYLAAAQAAFFLVSSDNLWIEASPKETDLTYVEPGQPATITVDTYPDVTFTGKVESISPASASSFSLLPAQNTSGNWIKVVQRIPVRVSIDRGEGKPVLRAGMSVELAIDTGHRRGLPRFLTRWFSPAASAEAAPAVAR